MAQSIHLGIDFSGAAAAWRLRCTRPTVWIATVDTSDFPKLIDVFPVQALPGTGEPFGRLVELLRAGGYAAAGIDAPFCIPAEYMPRGGHAALLAAVAALPNAPDRPFPSGASLVELAAAITPLRQKKPLRDTERSWAARGVNTRSTLWNGPRGGAPFAAACLTLLARADRPAWPWSNGHGMLVESFPAAQLKAWDLPHVGYAAPEQRLAREIILQGLRQRLDVDPAHAETVLSSPDALDAVLAAFGAIEATIRGAPSPVPADGLIAVSDEAPPNAAPIRDEQFQTLPERRDVRIERIVSLDRLRE